MNDDDIGSTAIKLTSLCKAKDVDEWFELEHEGKKAGSIHLKSEFVPLALPSVKTKDKITEKKAQADSGKPKSSGAVQAKPSS